MIESIPSGMERREGCRGRLFSVYVNHIGREPRVQGLYKPLVTLSSVRCLFRIKPCVTCCIMTYFIKTGEQYLKD